MAEERAPIAKLPNFGVDLGDIETNMISNSETENFLGTDPNEIEPIDTPPKASTKPKQPIAPTAPTEEPESPIVDVNILGEMEEEEDEEEEKPIPKGKKKEESPKEEEEEDVNVFGSLQKELTNLGVFTPMEGEEEITDPAQFRDRFNVEIQNRVENSLSDFIGRFGEDFQEAFQAIYINGVSPKEYFQQSNKIESLSEIDLAVVANQKLVLREYYKAAGLTNDKIEERIQKAEDRGDLEDDASSFHQILLQKEQKELNESVARKQQEQYQKQQQQAQYVAAVSKILNDKLTKKEFDGIPVDGKFAQQVGDYVTQNKWRLANGDLITDFDMDILNLRQAENYEKKVKLAMLMKMIEADPTLSKLQKVAVSKETNKLFADLTRKKRTAHKEGEESISSWGTI